MNLYNFVYVTTNSVTGKQYIGDHSTNNLNDTYVGSGKLIHEAIKKYGKENFKREILEHFDTKEDAFNAQEKYINEYNTLSPNGYNISPKGGHQVHGGVSEESKQKMKESSKNRIRKPLTESHKKSISNALKNKPLSEETKEKMRKPKSKEHRKHISECQKGKKISYVHKENIRLARTNGPGPNKGKHLDKISRKYS